MSSRAPNWFEQKYMSGVIHVLQNEGWATKEMTQMATDIKGNQVNWKLVGTGTATQMSTAIENRPVMNADRNLISATMADYEANDWINRTDIEKLTENEQQISQQTGGWAMGRKFDQVLFQTLDTAAGAIATVGTGAAAISTLDVMTAQANVLAAGVNGPQELYVALPYIVLAQLLQYREFSSSDYIGGEYPMLQKLGARKWLGMTFVPFPDSFFASSVANSLDGYMWMKSCVGRATNYALDSRIDYVAEKKAYFAANTMGYACALLQAPGVRRLRFATTAALTRPTP